MTHAVITGATGSIGASLVELLVEKKINVTVICRKNGRIQNIPKSSYVKIIECDLSEIKNIKNLEYADVFYHLAWVGTTGSGRNDTRLQSQNIEYALDAVDLAKSINCKKFIGVGTQAEYGLSNAPLTPSSPTNPFTGYGIAKLAAGQLTKIKCMQLGIDFAWIRVFSVYGKYDSDKSIIKFAINKFLNNETADFTKGEQIWDFLYADDAARALYLVGLDRKHSNCLYCLGSGQAKPLKCYIDEIHEVCKSHSKINYGEIPYSENQVMYLKADISALEKDVKFKPCYSFEQGLREMIKFM